MGRDFECFAENRRSSWRGKESEDELNKTILILTRNIYVRLGKVYVLCRIIEVKGMMIYLKEWVVKKFLDFDEKLYYMFILYVYIIYLYFYIFVKYYYYFSETITIIE